MNYTLATQYIPTPREFLTPERITGHPNKRKKLFYERKFYEFGGSIDSSPSDVISSMILQEEEEEKEREEEKKRFLLSLLSNEN